jgi:hypothetical protein
VAIRRCSSCIAKGLGVNRVSRKIGNSTKSGGLRLWYWL